MQASKRVAVVGSGMAGLTVACLLAKKGIEVDLIEQNWIAGGCTTTYPRKGFWFESGATTLVGLDEGMPLALLLHELGIELPAQKLETPMKVYLNGQAITRHQNIDAWVEEAERIFGSPNQRRFWEHCYGISQKVWSISGQQRAFPPQNLRDLIDLATHFRPSQVAAIPHAFETVAQCLQRFGLHENEAFCRFVDEQLIITAQNKREEVNMLFGATALCYTNFGNYYMPGGMAGLVNRLTEYLQAQGGHLLLRTQVTGIQAQADGVLVQIGDRSMVYQSVVSSIPLNNLHQLLPQGKAKAQIQSKLLPSVKLSSALQLGIGIRTHRTYDCLHHQIHLPSPLSGTQTHSIFVSLHPANDQQRAAAGEMAVSVSTHWPDPEHNRIDNREAAEEQILDALEAHDLLRRENILYKHSSGPKSWEKWTGRQWGFVGGYPQFKSIKPWQMMGARLQKGRLYVCGDTTYPGQGIPGAVLSGLIAFHKMKLDGAI
ncbi:MAG: amine oxidase [Sphingobacteriaceae bacterium]|nr:amine oxidase [Sphingobacteriaceae bacterium]